MTTEAKHTAGEWEVRDGKLSDEDRGRFVEIFPCSDEDGQMEAVIADVYLGHYGEALMQDHAHLIASAPALLAERDRLREALEAITDAYGCECVDGAPAGHCPMCQARAALSDTTE